MQDVLTLMFPILFLIGLGFAAVRTGYASASQIDGLAGFVVNFALPAIIFSTFTGQHLGETLNVAYLAAYAGGSLVAFAVVFAAMRYAMRRQRLARWAAQAPTPASSAFPSPPW